MKPKLTISLLAACLLLSLTAAAQYRFTWHKGLGIGLNFTGGYLNGMREAYHADPHVFERRFGASPTGFWGSESWKNKYQDYDGGDLRPAGPLAKWYPVDFWHVSATASRGMLVAGTVVVVIGERRKWTHYLLDVGISVAAFGLGSSAGYRMLRR